MRATGGTLQLRRSNSSRRICQIRPITNPSASAARIWIIVTATRLIGFTPLANHPDGQWLINRFLRQLKPEIRAVAAAAVASGRAT